MHIKTSCKCGEHLCTFGDSRIFSYLCRHTAGLCEGGRVRGFPIKCMHAVPTQCVHSKVIPHKRYTMFVPTHWGFIDILRQWVL